MIQEFVSQCVQKNRMTTEFFKNVIRILLLYFLNQKGVLWCLKKARYKMTFQLFLKNSKFRPKKQIFSCTIYLFIHKCTNWPKLYCNLLTLQNISCSDWSWNLHITMHNRVFRGSKLHLMRMGNIKCKNNADFFSLSLHNGMVFYWSSMSVCMLLFFFMFILKQQKRLKRCLVDSHENIISMILQQ